MLLKEDPKCNSELVKQSRPTDGCTPLHVAALRKKQDFVETILTSLHSTVELLVARNNHKKMALSGKIKFPSECIQFFSHLTKLCLKKEAMVKRKQQGAVQALDKLINTLFEQGKAYYAKPEEQRQQEKETFKANCTSSMHEASVTLDVHRGIKGFFDYPLRFICDVSKHRDSFFVPRTDTGKKLAAFEKSLSLTLSNGA